MNIHCVELDMGRLEKLGFAGKVILANLKTKIVNLLPDPERIVNSRSWIEMKAERIAEEEKPKKTSLREKIKISAKDIKGKIKGEKENEEKQTEGIDP